jgi:hypothetical protein
MAPENPTQARRIATIRHPIYFVHRLLEEWPELSDPNSKLTPDQCAARMGRGPNCWTIQTYMHLKSRGHDVHLRPDYVPNQINVLHYDDLALKHWPHRAFIVCIQPDRARAAAADLRLVQNHLQLRGSNDHFVYLWPQPGLLPRDPTRGTTIRRVGYLGALRYLAQPFRTDEFHARLRKLDMEFVLRAQDDEHVSYSDLDAVLAVRAISAYDLSIKPGGKLFNAWIAGCPALLGAEPAYQALRRSPLDYFEVNTPEEALAALQQLKNDPALYRQIVENGQRRAVDFSTELLCRQWEELFAGPVADGYSRWLRQRGIYRALRFGFRAFEHKRQLRRFFRLIRT